jgi:glycine/D-amino acid oxidase-like deaminating enzyme
LAGEKTDYIIVGGGLAGISLALELAWRGKKIVLLDHPESGSSSRIAAGIIHPIVPKGVRLTWKGETIFPLIPQWYLQWESRLNASFFQHLQGYQIHPNQDTADFWQLRSQTDEMKAWIAPLSDDNISGVSASNGYNTIFSCARLNTNSFLDAAVTWLKKNNIIEQCLFSHALLKKQDDQWQYGNHTADGVIFCEGIKALENPWFRHLHFHPTAGDILTLNFDGKLPQALYKNKNWLVPDGNGNWLAGSTFHKGSLETTPLKEDAEKLMEQIRNWTTMPFTVLQHRRGVRPTVEGRRPYLGEHPEAAGLFIYNGLGSKGSSLIPWLSPMMADFLCTDAVLDSEVDISRFDL